MNAHRPHRPLRSLFMWGSLIGVFGCGGGDGGGCGGGGSGDGDSTDCERGLVLPGDLVITELMPDPLGSDTDASGWFEIYNASPSDIDLRGAVLLYSRQNGDDSDVHLVGRSWVLPSGAYGVAGQVEDEEDLLAVLPFVDYGFGDDIDMGNTSGRVVVSCDDEIIDEVIYEEPTEAVSRGFTGDRLPDAAGNDDLTQWCDASTPLDTETLGTPGRRNDICLGTTGPILCLDPDTGEALEARAPALGDVLISEIMSDPSNDPNNPDDTDDTKEWFEVYAAADFDLNGLAVGKKLDLTDAVPVALNDCMPVAAGTRLVFGRNENPSTNGGLPRVDALFDFNINQDNAQLVLSYQGTLLDEYAYGSTDPGVAWSLDPRFHTIEGNDVRGFSCDATSPFGDGDLGTPGEPNPECEDIAAPEGQCFDDDGNLRDTVIPSAVGDVVITEIMPNPESSEDEASGEWFEIRADAPFDLAGLVVGRTDNDDEELVATNQGTCTPLAAGDYVVIAHETDPVLNGGLPRVDGTFGFSLGNTGDRGLWAGGTEPAPLDVVTWSSTFAGAALSLDPAASDPVGNDAPGNFCAAIDPYGDGDLGTPGEENPSCGGTPIGTCTDGGSDRDVVVPQPGDLVITELMPDPSAVTDANGEWFEVLATANVDLNGLQFGDDPTSPDGTLPAGGDCLAVTAGERVVVARNADEALNGGLPPVLQGTFSLTNGGGTLFVGIGNEALDTVTWTGSTSGAAWTVDPAAEDPVSNDDPMSWCVATDPYGAGDLGTPGAQGPDCGGGMAGDGMCLDGGVPRAIVSPAAGELVISEWMPNPNVVPDGDGEWFEVYVGADIDLNELQLSRATDVAGPFSVQTTIASADCLPVPAGSFVVFARGLDPMVNGALPAADHVFTFGLNNSNAGIAVGVADVMLDQVVYTSSTAGSATQLDPAALTPAGNDDVGNLCPAITPYSPDNDGTPGAANPSC